MHSVASRFGDRISTRWPRSHARVRTGHARHVGRNRRPNDRVLPRRLTIAYSRSPLHCAALRVACERREAQRNRTLQTTHPHSPLKCTAFRDSRNRIFTSRHARGSATHARSARMRDASNHAKIGKPRQKGASPDRTPPSPLNSTAFRVVSRASCPQPASCIPYHPVTLTCEMHRAPSRFGVRISTTDRAARLSSNHRPERPRIRQPLSGIGRKAPSRLPRRHLTIQMHSVSSRLGLSTSAHPGCLDRHALAGLLGNRRMTAAGLPPTSTFGGTSRVTTAPAATTEFSPPSHRR